MMNSMQVLLLLTCLQILLVNTFWVLDTSYLYVFCSDSHEYKTIDPPSQLKSRGMTKYYVVLAVVLLLEMTNLILYYRYSKIYIHVSTNGSTVFINTSDLRNWGAAFLKPQEIDCTGYIEGDMKAIRQGLALQSSYKRKAISDQNYVEFTKDCKDYVKQRGYIIDSSEEEQRFPIAFSILLHKDAEQAERLLRAIYRPQNLFCIHVDSKSPLPLHIAMASIAGCFPNVFIVTKSEYVVYEGFSRLMADINCMKDLVARNHSWTYFINLPSTEFPLKTNLEIVKILKIYNGSNDIEGITSPDRRLAHRFLNRHTLEQSSGSLHIRRTTERHYPPPHNITVVKGSAYGIFSRAFVEFLLTDSRVKDFLKWCESVKSPDEYFWSTIHHQDKYQDFKVPGGYQGEPENKAWLAAYANWGEVPCYGKYVHGVCVFGLRDIARLTSRKELFANKFYINFHPFAYMCMEEWLHNKTSSNIAKDLYYYRQLPFINQVNTPFR